jgi:hypothetical protein
LPRETAASKKSQLPASTDAARAFFRFVNYSASKMERARVPAQFTLEIGTPVWVAVSQMVCCWLRVLEIGGSGRSQLLVGASQNFVSAQFNRLLFGRIQNLATGEWPDAAIRKDPHQNGFHQGLARLPPMGFRPPM